MKICKTTISDKGCHVPWTLINDFKVEILKTNDDLKVCLSDNWHSAIAAVGVGRSKVLSVLVLLSPLSCSPGALRRGHHHRTGINHLSQW